MVDLRGKSTLPPISSNSPCSTDKQLPAPRQTAAVCMVIILGLLKLLLLREVGQSAQSPHARGAAVMHPAIIANQRRM